MNTKPIKKPISSGVARVPVIMQMEELECGAACLAMVLAYYGAWIPLEQVRTDCGVCRDGSSAESMMIAAEHYGLHAQGYWVEPEEILSDGKFPCVIHWNFNHFVVLNGFRGGKACLNDPARGTVTVSMEEFDKAFTGVCILLTPTGQFRPQGRKKSMLGYVKNRLQGLKLLILFTAIISLLTTVLTMTHTAMIRVFMDCLLTGKNPDWVMPFFTGLSLLILLRFGVSLLQCNSSLRISGKLVVVGELTYMWKVLRLPMSFFTQRTGGDILSRAASNAAIGNTLINQLSPLLFDSVMMIFYLAVMLRYNWIMTMVGIGSVLVNIAASMVISRLRLNITRVQLRDSGKLSGITLSGIQMAETIKSTGAEPGFFERWSGYQASVNLDSYRFEKVNTYLGMIPSFASAAADLAVMGMGIYLVIQGEFTLGMITGFQGFLASFTSPARRLITVGQVIQEMRSSVERVEDVMEYPEDPVYEQSTAPEDGHYEKLSGAVEINGISFGYAPLGDPLIENISLNISPGQSIAFVGSSGCGKSTIARLIAGLHHPWSGSITFDGKTCREISRENFTGSVAVVDQDIILFADTIANNIKMRDNSILDFEMILAARDAQIHEDIMARPDGYQTMLTEGGSNLSGGQRQRLEIARVLAQDPVIIILDEATSALDAKTEYEVIRSIRQRGITCIIVAHRLSTIRDCDQIIVLDHGHIAQQGSHEELMEQKDGIYAALVTSE